jgi:hypothetical protein
LLGEHAVRNPLQVNPACSKAADVPVCELAVVANALLSQAPPRSEQVASQLSHLVATCHVGGGVGAPVGAVVGIGVGDTVGATVGVAVGTEVGAFVGVAVGTEVSAFVGAAVGVAVGPAVVLVGVAVGVAVGAAVGACTG